MLAFIVRRTIGLIVVLFAISVLTFLIFFAIPGIDPARSLAGRNPTPQTIAAVKHQFGLDRPLPVQYLLMMKRLFISRDLVSYGNQALKVVPAITSAAPATFSLVRRVLPKSGAIDVLGTAPERLAITVEADKDA